MKRLLIILTSLTLVALILYYVASGSRLFNRYEVGQAIDSLNGVIVYYNGKVSHVESRNTSTDGYNLGLKYQCVEFVKRYYYQHLNHKMSDSYGHAKDFFDPDVEDGLLNKKRGLTQYTNLSKSKPKANDLLIMDGHAFNPYGHVAIISLVLDNELEIIQQNPGPGSPSRKRIGLEEQNGKWKINEDKVLGWLRKD